jgi:hypothetical protein
MEAAIVIGGTFAACAATYEIVRRLRVLRPLFGLRPGVGLQPAHGGQDRVATAASQTQPLRADT